MDSNVTLALMVKAQKVFGREDTFLSFPLSPIPYTIGQLDFLTNPYDDPAKMRCMVEFSRLVNMIPSGTLWPPSDEGYLWNPYDEVLRRSRVASLNRNAQEEADLQRALQVLETAPGTPSPVAIAYNQCRDEWINATQDYQNARIAADTATDAVKKEQWRTVEEPVLRQRIDLALQNWNTTGRKAEVEEAQRVRQMLEAHSPAATMAGWRACYNPELDLQTGVTGVPFAWSGYTPSNAFADNAWQTFTLNGAEARAMIQQAPRDLAARLATAGSLDDVESISFQYSSVSVVRPWLATDVFKARFWQFSDASRRLSNGANPPVGECTGYVSAVVFARRVSVVLKSSAGGTDDKREQFRVLGSLKAAEIRAAAAKPVVAAPGVRPGPAVATKPVSGRPVIGPQIAVPVQHPAATQLTHQKPAVNPAFTSMMTKISTVNLQRVNLKRELLPKMLKGGFRRIPIAVRPTTTPPAPPPANPANEEVFIMAFIVKRLPLCPNADPQLRWT